MKSLSNPQKKALFCDVLDDAKETVETLRRDLNLAHAIHQESSERLQGWLQAATKHGQILSAVIQLYDYSRDVHTHLTPYHVLDSIRSKINCSFGEESHSLFREDIAEAQKRITLAWKDALDAYVHQSFIPWAHNFLRNGTCLANASSALENAQLLRSDCESNQVDTQALDEVIAQFQGISTQSLPPSNQHS